MFQIFQHVHSILRWLVLGFLAWNIYNAWMGRSTQKTFADGDRTLALRGLILTHVQFLLGLLLYFTSSQVQFSAESMKDPVLRFFLVEHVSIMLLGIVMVTIGFVRMKRAQTDGARFQQILVFYLIGLLLFLAGIPWPFGQYGGHWF